MCRYCRTVLGIVQKNINRVRIKILIGNWRVQGAQSFPKVIKSRRWKTTKWEIRYGTNLNGTGSLLYVLIIPFICKMCLCLEFKSINNPPSPKKTLKFCINEFIYCVHNYNTVNNKRKITAVGNWIINCVIHYALSR